VLSVTGVQASYGRSQVLFDINLAVSDGEIVTLLGRNGMGKTTTVRAIMGLTSPTAGRIEFCGRDITRAAPEAIARAGIGLIPEGRQVFPTLTVHENIIATAANRRKLSSPWTAERLYSLFPALRERQTQFAATLSGGEQQMLAIARALMTNPSLLIFDEATEGLAPNIRAEIWTCIEMLRREGQAILIIDKTLKVLKRIADRHYIVQKGRTVWSGSSQELDAASELVQQYLGL
jgi:branched-chain amino acid transport system ATP-binding protein